MRRFDLTFESKGEVGVRRLEVITGVGGRRAWSHEDKGRIVAESFAAGADVSAVARVSPSNPHPDDAFLVNKCSAYRSTTLSKPHDLDITCFLC